MLLHIPGILDPAQAARMRQRLEAARWIDGRETVLRPHGGGRDVG